MGKPKPKLDLTDKTIVQRLMTELETIREMAQQAILSMCAERADKESGIFSLLVADAAQPTSHTNTEIYLQGVRYEKATNKAYLVGKYFDTGKPDLLNIDDAAIQDLMEALEWLCSANDLLQHS